MGGGVSGSEGGDMKLIVKRQTEDGRRVHLPDSGGVSALRQWGRMWLSYSGSGKPGYRPATLPLADRQLDFPDLAGRDLGYRLLQALVTRDHDLVLEFEDEEKKPGDGAAPTAQAQGGQAGKGKPGPEGKPLVQIKASLNPGGGSRGQRKSVIWRPFPTPKKADVAKARRILTAMYEEAVEHAREVAPIRWSPGRLAVYGRMGQPDRARVWEEQGLPRLLLAIDNSGSIGGQVTNLRAFGAAMAEAAPWLLVMAAPNGEPMPLAVRGAGTEKNPMEEVDAILDGENWTPPGVKLGGGWDAWAQVDWREVCRVANVVGIVYVGDYEDEWLAQFPDARRGTISIQYCAQKRAVEVASGAYARERAWPAVVGMDGSIERSLAALELLLKAWRRG